MIYEWMRNDVADTLDLDKILSGDKEEISHAATSMNQINKEIKALKSNLAYAHFLRTHYEDIKTNYEITDTIIDYSYRIFALCKDGELKKHISIVSYEKMSAYNRFLKISNYMDTSNIRVGTIEVPANPFPAVKKDLKDFCNNTTNRNAIETTEKMIIGINTCDELAKEIENLVLSLVQYDISSEEPDFDADCQVSFNSLFSNQPEAFDITLAEVEEKELFLQEKLEQIEMVKTTLKENNLF